MVKRFGVVSNCWKTALDNGELFEDLVTRFCRAGLNEIEVRDDDYLRRSSLGGFIESIEHMAAGYEPAEWREFCDGIHGHGSWSGLIRDKDSACADLIARFTEQTKDAVFSYAMAYPWLSKPADKEADNRRIITAVKLAYLLNPALPRLRLVSREEIETIDSETAVGNLKRYQTLAPDCPSALNVENAFHPAPVFLELARVGGLPLAYDEANNYRLDGSALNTPDEFWLAVKVEDLASVHLKQKNEQGALGRLGDGFVDLHGVMKRLKSLGYTGDLLFENAPTEDPLADAIASRDFLS